LRAGKAEHEQQRPDDAAEQDDSAKPRHIAFAQRGFFGRKAESRPGEMDAAKSYSRPEIQQPGE
jgi:hypothetical protein